MAGYNVIPSLRFRDLPAAVDFYTQSLGFKVVRGEPGEANISIDRGDAHLMLESHSSFYSQNYNEAIRMRLGTPSANALYIEAEDLDDLYAKAQAAGVVVVDPIAPRAWGQTEFTVEDLDGNWLTFWKALG